MRQSAARTVRLIRTPFASLPTQSFVRVAIARSSTSLTRRRHELHKRALLWTEALSVTGSSYRVVLCEARTGIVLNDDGSRFIEGISIPSDHWFDDLGEALVCKDELLGRLPFADVEVTVTAGPAGFQPLTFRPDPALSLPLLSSRQARVESSSATSPQRLHVAFGSSHLDSQH